MNKLYTVITTIQEPTDAVLTLHRRLQEIGGWLVIAGDAKGPVAWYLPDCDFLTLTDQLASGFSLAEALPTGHYARKNISYLHAIRLGARCIYETDDDNAPLPTWQPHCENILNARKIESISNYQDTDVSVFCSKWVNIYRYFTNDQHIWPRGIPLDRINSSASVLVPVDASPISSDTFIAPIQQGLVNGAPDVDAVWRLTQDRLFEFEQRLSIWLSPGLWCPFNSQSTWWWPEAYTLLYLPSHCSFRMTDIWRSFIAQRCLWEMGYGMVFHGPEVVQVRNPHDLMRDFNDEIPGYQRNRELVEVLESLNLRTGADAVPDNLRTCYEALVARDFFPPAELALVNAWLHDLEVIG